MLKQIQSQNISVRQALIMFVLLMGSPSVRSLPAYTVKYAKQAAWLCPVFAFVVIIIYLFILQKIFSRYENESLLQIMENIFGKVAGKALGIIFFLYISVAAAYYIRYYSERLVSSLSISTSYIVYIAILLIFLSFVLKYDLNVLARISEILLLAVVVFYMTMNILVLPKVKISNFYPITYTDFLPVLGGALGIISLWSYITFIFMLSDRIGNKKNTYKLGIKAFLLLTVLTVFVICMPLGVFGTSVWHLNYPYASAIQYISLFDTIERVDSIIVAIWIMTDFSLISAFIFAGLHTLKSTFKLSDYKTFINIYILALFFLSIYIAKNVFELEIVAMNVLKYINILLGIGIPFALFFVGKIRRKI